MRRLLEDGLVEQDLRSAASRLHTDVVTVAKIDRNAARELLVRGSPLVDQLPVLDVLTMISAVRLDRYDDPFALDYLDLECRALERAMLLDEAIATTLRAHRIAARLKSRPEQARAAARLAFQHIEKGDMGNARLWIDGIDLRQARWAHTLVANCQVAFEWNVGRMESAIELAVEAAETLPDASRVDSLHFWSNMSYLAAEAGTIGLSEEASSRAGEFMSGDVDVAAQLTLVGAYGERQLKLGEAEDAAETFTAMAVKAQSADSPLVALYALEALSEVHALRDSPGAALQLWHGIERARSGRFTPRLQARKDRITALTAR